MRKRIILMILIFLNLATIFFFSHQNGSESTAVSTAISRQIEVSTPGYESKSLGERNSFHVHTQKTLRHWAHALLFFTLGILMYLFLNTFPKKWYRFPMVLVIGFLIALGDEIHQLYVPGRSYGWDDISYDMLGFLSGILVICLFIFAIKCIKKETVAK